MAFSSNKIIYVLLSSLLTLVVIRPVNSASVINQYLQNGLDKNTLGEGRIFWNSVADFMESSSYFPITINVPDMIAGIGNMMSNVYDFIFGVNSSESEDTGTAHTVNHPRSRNILK